MLAFTLLLITGGLMPSCCGCNTFESAPSPTPIQTESPSGDASQPSAEPQSSTASTTTSFSPSGHDEVKARNAKLYELILFQPTRFPEGNWAPQGLDFEDVTLQSEDGTKLHGWYCPAVNSRAVVLFLHGNGGHLADRAGLLRLLQTQMQLTTFIVDYGGYGKSEGTATIAGALADARAARKWLADREGIPQSQIVLMGRSLGGALAIQLAKESPARALVVESSFSSLREEAKAHFPKLAWIVPKGELDSGASIAHHHGPVLISHGDADRVIPFAMGQKLYDTANEPKTFVRITGGDHNDPQTAEYYQTLSRLIADLKP